MAIPIQKTKLFIPPACLKPMVRPRLIQRLDRLREGGGRVALISAPAGSGKTTLALLDLPGIGMEEVITLLTNGLVEALSEYHPSPPGANRFGPHPWQLSDTCWVSLSCL